MNHSARHSALFLIPLIGLQTQSLSAIIFSSSNGIFLIISSPILHFNAQTQAAISSAILQYDLSQISLHSSLQMAFLFVNTHDNNKMMNMWLLIHRIFSDISALLVALPYGMQMQVINTRLLASGPLGLLYFVFYAFLALKPCDQRDAASSMHVSGTVWWHRSLF